MKRPIIFQNFQTICLSFQKSFYFVAFSRIFPKCKELPIFGIISCLRPHHGRLDFCKIEDIIFQNFQIIWFFHKKFYFVGFSIIFLNVKSCQFLKSSKSLLQLEANKVCVFWFLMIWNCLALKIGFQCRIHNFDQQNFKKSHLHSHHTQHYYILYTPY